MPHHIGTVRRTLSSITLLTALFASGAQAADDPRDFSGVWQAVASDMGSGRLSTSSPLTPEGAALVTEATAPYPNMVEQGAWCVPPGMPDSMTAMVSYPIEITQTPKRITMLVEMESQYRRVWMDGRAHPDDYLPTRMGHSIAQWEGDTLVIETALLSEELFSRTPRTEQTRITERVSKMKRADLNIPVSGFINNATIDDNLLAFEISTVDPLLYSEPQKITVYYQHISDYDMLEYDCAVQIWRNELEESN